MEGLESHFHRIKLRLDGRVLGAISGGAQRRCQNANQQRDDRHHGQQLDQRKCLFAVCGVHGMNS
jgi:hypothetical protein